MILAHITPHELPTLSLAVLVGVVIGVGLASSPVAKWLRRK